VSDYIDLGRRFRGLTQKELEDPESLISMVDLGFGDVPSWAEVLAHPRVIILAEAGSGKTREMREQAARLAAEGKAAFFVALETLDRETISQTFDATQAARFEKWKENPDETAWFFLDAVDELKLTSGKLDRALAHLAREIGEHLDRVHVVISCRPSDWRAQSDLSIVNDRLPVRRTDVAETVDPKENFLAAVRQKASRPSEQNYAAAKHPDKTAPWTVALLPLSDAQIRKFAERSDVKDIAAFIAEIDRKDAGIFARRPLDLVELIAAWNAQHDLGTRSEQHEANIRTKLRGDPERPDAGALSDADANAGAKRLALALALSRCATLKAPSQELGAAHAEGVLDPNPILADWTDVQRSALLRRGLFDPATYGRVRFHHRSVQEYLAAQRLHELRKAGMSAKALLGLLFNEKYGEKVVIPSMRSIAAWLALWDSDVRREVIEREPEVLLTHGDPESLSLDSKRTLLRAFAAAYGEGGWRGINIPIAEVRRIATPELSATIRELWGSGPTGEDFRELLVEIIWQGGISECADLAFAAASDKTWSYGSRTTAIRALVATKADEYVRQINTAIEQGEPSWPDYIAHQAVEYLFPTHMSVEQLMNVVSRAKIDKRVVGGLDWSVRRIAETIDPATVSATQLRDEIAELIWNRRDSNQSFYETKSAFSRLAPALAILCGRQLNANVARDDKLLRATAISARFSANDYEDKESLERLSPYFAVGSDARERMFWTEIELMDQLAPEPDPWKRMFHGLHHSVLRQLHHDDSAWLEQGVSTGGNQRKAVALHALLDFATQAPDREERWARLRELCKGDNELEAILAERTNPRPPNPELEARIHEHAQVRKAQATKEEERVKGWDEWRDNIMREPDKHFGPDSSYSTIQNMYRWLRLRGDHPSRFNLWDREAIAGSFDEATAKRMEQALSKFWRSQKPIIAVHRTEEESNSTPYSWAYAICGVAAESSKPGWAAALNVDEARTAVRLATVELNGFAPFLPELARTHPAIVERELGDAVAAEFSNASADGHLSIVSNLAYGDATVRALLRRRVASVLTESSKIRLEPASTGKWAHNSSLLLRILEDEDDPQTRKRLADLCEARFVEDPNGKSSLVWMQGLFSFDVDRGVRVLSEYLTDSARKGANHEHSMHLIGGLFGDRNPTTLTMGDPALRSRALGRLLRLAYALIRPNEDQDHGGRVFSPNDRDHAEQGRSYLLNALINTPGAEARLQLLELAKDPNFSHFPDRLRRLAKQRAAEDSEFPPYPVEEIARLDANYELPPVDRDGLFRTMMDRLDDLAHEISHHDFTDRGTLLTIRDEPAMQRTLALRLDYSRRNAFQLTREEEVADGKLTDIRLLASNGDQRAVIEIKLGQKAYSVRDYESTLRDQIVGKYLRHENCKAGCLLITFNGERSHWEHPETKARLSFAELVDYLNVKAQEIERENQYRIRLAVVGLDLTGK